jgi:methylthioribose-1-phosphate isomerase
MPLVKGKSKEDCISKAYKDMIAAGHPEKQAQAAALNHCNEVWGGIEKKDSKKEVSDLKEAIDSELKQTKDGLVNLQNIKEVLQNVVNNNSEASFEEWSKRQGFKGICQESINKAALIGGFAAKKALFEVNKSKGKFYYPNKKVK